MKISITVLIAVLMVAGAFMSKKKGLAIRSDCAGTSGS
jgi:hypothetical protein